MYTKFRQYLEAENKNQQIGMPFSGENWQRLKKAVKPLPLGLWICEAIMEKLEREGLLERLESK